MRLYGHANTPRIETEVIPQKDPWICHLVSTDKSRIQSRQGCKKQVDDTCMSLISPFLMAVQSVFLFLSFWFIFGS